MRSDSVLFDTNDRFLRWYWELVGLFEWFGCDYFATVSLSERCVKDGRGNGSKWMLGCLNANRVPYPIADLSDLTAILEILSKPLTVVWSVSLVKLLFSSPILPALASSSLLYTPSLAVLSTEYFSSVPLPHLVLIASPFSFTHACSAAVTGMLWLLLQALHASTTPGFHSPASTRQSLLVIVFIVSAMWHWAVLLS